MAQLIGKDNVVVLWGANDISSYWTDLSIARSNDIQEITTFGSTAKKYIRGIDDGDVVLTGLYDDTATNIDGILNTAFGNATGVVATMGNAKFALGKACYLLSARTRDYKIEAGHSTLQKLSANIKPDGGIDRGISLHDLVAATAATDFSSVNNSASTANGGVAHINVTAATLTSATVKVQHSANDVAWADLVTFTAVTGTTSERVVVPAGTTVNQYLRASISAFNGTTFTFVAAFARR